ncbi:RibD family protein [Salinisphaera aquimarina]|uniref:RibD family protein n=1 Tax=Salinisphaera aquimarina TaxID=2094031 RepID=A0ABV7ERX0_9GAMM
MSIIDENYAWQCIRDANAARATVHAVSSWAVGNGPELTVDAGGRWHSDSPVDAAARDLLDTLLPVALGGDRFVIAQLGQSLDGRIATESGHSHYVTGEASRVHLHRLRALVDAVLVGAGTADADDPQLTVRHVQGSNPVRVVLDPNGRVPRERAVFTDPAAPTLHIAGRALQPAAGGHVETLTMACDAQGLAPEIILARLAERGLRRVLVEGGGQTVSRFLQAGVLDRLHVVVAPMLIGSGRPAVTLPTIDVLDDALRPPCRTTAMGADMLFDLDLRVADMGHASA